MKEEDKRRMEELKRIGSERGSFSQEEIEEFVPLAAEKYVESFSEEQVDAAKAFWVKDASLGSVVDIRLMDGYYAARSAYPELDVLYEQLIEAVSPSDIPTDPDEINAIYERIVPAGGDPAERVERAFRERDTNSLLDATFTMFEKGKFTETLEDEVKKIERTR